MTYKLLIVDDEPHILDGMKETLNWTSLGFDRVDTARDYAEAYDKAVEIQPDIALFDVCIGEARGYDIISKFNLIGLKTKYIMISGYDEFEYVRKAMMCGAKAYLVKPVDRQELQSAVEKIIVEDLGGTLPETGDPAETLDPVLNTPYKSMSKLTNKILLIVQTDYAVDLSLKAVADRFKMNKTYIGQIFFRDTRLKFSEYLMVYRLLKAKELVVGTDEKAISIAHQVGYTNMQYFYTHFHAFFGVSPSDLRKPKKEEED